MRAKAVVRRVFACSSLVSTLSLIGVATQSANAAEITLHMKGGEFRVSGQLLAFDEKHYSIDTEAFGHMRLSTERYTCVSDVCPTGPYVRETALQAAAFGTGDPAGRITITGSKLIAEKLMPALVDAYARTQSLQVEKITEAEPVDMTFKLRDSSANEMGVIELQSRNSEQAFAALKAKEALVGMSARPVSKAEVKALGELKFGDMRSAANEHVIALSGLVVLVPPSNALTEISLENLANVFSGKIKDWSEIKGPSGKINIYAPAETSASWQVFQSSVLAPRNLKIVESATRIESSSELATKLAADPLGIAISHREFQGRSKALGLTTSCGLKSAPTQFSLKAEEYLFSRRMYLYTPGEPANHMAKGLLKFALSDDAQDLIEKAGFMNQQPDSLTFSEQTQRFEYAPKVNPDDFDKKLMDDMTDELKDAQRSSFTFRFSEGTANLDSKAFADIARLSAALTSDPLKGKTIILAGFADSVGPFDGNLQLSSRRAETVLNALKEHDATKLEGIKVVTKGYGEIAPVACNDTAQTQAINRRVEVWFKE